MLYQLQSEIDDEFTDGEPDEDADWEDADIEVDAHDPYDIEYDH